MLDVILHPIKTAEDIYDNTKRSVKIFGTVADGITKAFDATDPIQWSNVGDYIYDSFAYQHASKNFVADNPEIAAIMSDPNAAPEAKQYAQQMHLNYLSDQLGIERSDLLIYNSDFINQGPAAESGGMFVKETGNIYLNTGEIAEDDTFANTLGHEVSHSIDQSNSRNYGEDYADLMGGNLNDSLNMEFDLANLQEITNTVRTSEQWREQNKNNPLIINNTYSAGLFEYDEVEQDVAFVIGGPYGSHRYGHVALRVYDDDGNQYDKTYDFGRYQGVRGDFGEIGDGILKVWNDFNKYIESEKSIGRITNTYIFKTNKEHDLKIIGQYNDMIKELGIEKAAGDYMKQYKLNADYHWGKNNCTTISKTNFELGTDINLGEDITGRGLNWIEKQAAKIKGYPEKTFMPQDIENILNKRKNIIKNVPEKRKNIVKEGTGK